jgi:hypothetical protein
MFIYTKRYFSGTLKGKYYGNPSSESSWSFLSSDYDIEVYETDVESVCEVSEDTYHESFILNNYKSVENLFKQNLIRVHWANATYLVEPNLIYAKGLTLFDVVKSGDNTFGTLRCEVIFEVLIPKEIPDSLPEQIPSNLVEVKTVNANQAHKKEFSKVNNFPSLTLKEIFLELLVHIPLLIGLLVILSSIVGFVFATGLYGLYCISFFVLAIILNQLFPSLWHFFLSPFRLLRNLFKSVKGFGWLSFSGILICIYFIIDTWLGFQGYILVFLFSFLIAMIASTLGFLGRPLRIIGSFLSWIFIISILLSFLIPTQNRVGNYPIEYNPIKNINSPTRIDSTFSETKDTKDTTGNSLPDVTHTRIWNDYQDSLYQFSYYIQGRNVEEASALRNKLTLDFGSFNDFTNVFEAIDRLETPKMGLFWSKIDSIGKQKQLNTQNMADMIVSMVQDIPYVALSPNNDCQSWPCNTNVALGLQTPNEFLYNLKADCDTRALLLYLTLRNFGYDAVILGSPAYQHAVIGIAIPAQGTYKMYQGKRYYVWETTSLGWQLGNISPNVSDMNQWFVIYPKHNNFE